IPRHSPPYHRYRRDSCPLQTIPPVPTPYPCSTSFSHSSPVAEWAHHCPTDTSAHPSLVPLSPIPLRSAVASRPSGNMYSHPTNPPSRPDTSDGTADSRSSILAALHGRWLPGISHIAPRSLRTCPCNRHRGRPDARAFPPQLRCPPS